MYKNESLLNSNGTLKWSHIKVIHPISNRWSPYIKWRYQICINYQRKKQKDYYYQWRQTIITIWRHFLDEFNEQSWPLSFENWIFTFEPMQPVLITRKVVNYVPTSGEASLIEKKCMKWSLSVSWDNSVLLLISLVPSMQLQFYWNINECEIMMWCRHTYLRLSFCTKNY